MKPNAIVHPRYNPGYVFYGRIWKILPDTRVVVICCGKHITIYNQSDLVIVAYKGTWAWGRDPSEHRFPVFNRMPSLRKLKQSASRYHPDIWKRQRRTDLPKHTSYYKSSA